MPDVLFHELGMSGLGQKRRFERQPITSGLPQTTDIGGPAPLVRFVPIGDSCTAQNDILFDHLLGFDK